MSLHSRDQAQQAKKRLVLEKHVHDEATDPHYYGGTQVEIQNRSLFQTILYYIGMIFAIGITGLVIFTIIQAIIN